VRGTFEFKQPRKSFIRSLAAHFFTGAQPGTYGRSIGMAIQSAAVVRRQLHATNARRLAAGHARDGRRNGQGNTAGPAAYPTFNRLCF